MCYIIDRPYTRVTVKVYIMISIYATFVQYDLCRANGGLHGTATFLVRMNFFFFLFKCTFPSLS